MNKAISKLRLTTGFILFAFVSSHFANHAFGLISLEAMAEAHRYFMTVWRTPLGTAVLGAAALVHLGIALRAIYVRRTLKLARWEWAQLILGLSIPPLIFSHILATRVAEIQGVLSPGYELTIAMLWVGSPVDGVLQAVVLVIAWVHGCIGIGIWLKLKPWYGKWRRVFQFVAFVLPTLALSGYISAGFELLAELDRGHTLSRIFTESQFDERGASEIISLKPIGYAIAFSLISLPFVGRLLRDSFSRLGSRPVVSLPDGRQLKMQPGSTVLECLREHGIPHASVCGGRGRCTTCRIRVMSGGRALDTPEDIEAAALSRINAMEGVRLACQIKPTSDLAITPLLPPQADAAAGMRPGGLEGEERRITCLFIDIRGSTRLGDEKLPYDVLFILNQFFAEMNQAITETNGHYAQFNGDGLMALYGMDPSVPVDTAARQALNAARNMLARVQRLNESLKSELPFPLEVGIGIHQGDAIVGAMGPPQAQMTSAIGDTINTAARLESLTKTYGAPVIVSEITARSADLDVTAARSESVTVRGRARPVNFFIFHELPEPAESGAKA